MWDLDDETLYFKFLDARIPHAFTWGDKDRDKREMIRRAVASKFPAVVPDARWWAFRLYARKAGSQGFDVENIPKLVIDAFARLQIQRDGSQYPQLGIYEDDKIDSVGMVQVAGESSRDGDSTVIQVFGRRA
jgi:hypothetical protein